MLPSYPAHRHRNLLSDGNPGASEGRVARRTVRDPLGRKIGRLERLFLNETGGPEYAEVRTGLLGMKTVLIPLQTVTADAERPILVLE
jgi:hypothetical protein